MKKVAVIIPTNRDVETVRKVLDVITAEITHCSSMFEIKVFLILNNIENSGEYISLENQYPNVHIHDAKDCEGKNDAVNKAVDHVKKDGYDIVHFFDDDVVLQPFSLNENLVTLSKFEGKPIVVGSNFYSDISERKGIKHYLFSIPYTEKSDLNYFIAGASYCCELKYMPPLPSSTTEVAEDSYVSIYFASIGDGLNSIIKPAHSQVYFDLPRTFKEWFTQQVRVYVGVEKSFECFPDEYEKNQLLFAWRYAENKEYRRKFRKIPFTQVPGLMLLRFCQFFIKKVGDEKIKLAKKVEWR